MPFPRSAANRFIVRLTATLAKFFRFWRKLFSYFVEAVRDEAISGSTNPQSVNTVAWDLASESISPANLDLNICREPRVLPSAKALLGFKIGAIQEWQPADMGYGNMAHALWPLSLPLINGLSTCTSVRAKWSEKRCPQQTYDDSFSTQNVILVNVDEHLTPPLCPDRPLRLVDREQDCGQRRMQDP